MLAAIPQMQPWVAASKNDSWVLREAGKQLLVYGAHELNLSDESGVFRVNVVNPKTGEIQAGATVTAGAKVKLPDATVVWLVKESL